MIGFYNIEKLDTAIKNIYKDNKFSHLFISDNLHICHNFEIRTNI